jgi:hypothetical protein
MLGPDVVVVEALRFILGQGQDLACPIGELVETVHTYHRVYGTTVVRCVRRPIWAVDGSVPLPTPNDADRLTDAPEDYRSEAIR